MRAHLTTLGNSMLFFELLAVRDVLLKKSNIIFIAETKAKIPGPDTIYIKSGSTLKLSCKVYLGPRGPDQDYRQHAVVHWFHEQRLLDPALEIWKSR